METKNINYKSDFKLFEQSDTGYAVPFRFSFFTDSPKRTFEATYDGHYYEGCSLMSDGKLCIAFDDHGLGLGTLKVERRYYLSDADYASGICDLVIDARDEIVTERIKTEKTAAITKRSQLVYIWSEAEFDVVTVLLDLTDKIELKSGDVVFFPQNCYLIDSDNVVCESVDVSTGGVKVEITDGGMYKLAGSSIDSVTYKIEGDVYYNIALTLNGTDAVNSTATVPAYYQKGDPGLSAAERAELLAALASEQSRVSAESSRVSAESARVSAESSRVSAESARVSAEQGRVSAESSRVSAEQGRQIAESGRNARYQSAEQARDGKYDVAEDARDALYAQAESERNTSFYQSEEVRNQPETARANAEKARQQAEAQRDLNEDNRKSAENARMARETARQQAEQLRVNAENVRVNNELNRVSAEQNRVSAENARHNEWVADKVEIESAITRSQQAAQKAEKAQTHADTAVTAANTAVTNANKAVNTANSASANANTAANNANQKAQYAQQKTDESVERVNVALRDVADKEYAYIRTTPSDMRELIESGTVNEGKQYLVIANNRVVGIYFGSKAQAGCELGVTDITLTGGSSLA